jgi:hypothetical protein
MKRVILFCDGSATAVFEDGSGIVLSSNCTRFRYLAREGDHSTHQLTAFATFKNYSKENCEEDSKQKLIQVIQFVNRHMEHPYLCTNILPEHTRLVRSKNLYKRASWSMSPDGVHIHQDSSISLTSQENTATITLLANRRMVTIQYLAKVQDTRTIKSQKHSYVWLEQVFSLNQYPQRWKEAVELLLLICDDSEKSAVLNENVITFLPSTKEPVDFEHVTKEETSLVTCEMYLKLLRSSDYDSESLFTPSKDLDVSSNILMEKSPDATFVYLPVEKQVEVRLCNGDVLLSNTDRTSFTHWMVSDDGIPLQRVYHLQTIPKNLLLIAGDNLHQKIELSRLTKSAVRFLLNADLLQVRKKAASGAPSMHSCSNIFVEQVVSGLGKFTLFEDRSAKAVFNDRTTVKISDNMAHVVSKEGEELDLSIELALGYEDYVKVVNDFLQWATRSEEQKLLDLEIEAENLKARKEAESLLINNQIFFSAKHPQQFKNNQTQDFNSLIVSAARLTVENKALLRRLK